LINQNPQEWRERKRLGRPAHEQSVVFDNQTFIDNVSEADQKLKGPLSVRGSSSRRPLQVDLSKLEVSCFLLVLKVIIKLFLMLAPIH
jgi:hypothetical protein